MIHKSTEPVTEGLGEIDWETAGQASVRHEVAMLAERWHWAAEPILHMPVRVRKSYWHRMMEYVEHDKKKR